MPKYRLINCDFLDDSKFKVELSNKAKLLYLYMFISADDRGFVGKTLEIIKTLNENDENFGDKETLNLVPYTYENALNELMDRGLLFEFTNKYKSKTHLIRHWYCHNKYYKKAWTNYSEYSKLVRLKENEYVLRKKGEPVEEESKLDDWDKMITDLEKEG